MSEYHIKTTYDAVVKTVDVWIACKSSGQLGPLTQESYDVIEQTVALSERQASISGRSVYEEVYLYLCGRYPTDEEEITEYV